MTTRRRRFTVEFRKKAALEAPRGADPAPAVATWRACGSPHDPERRVRREPEARLWLPRERSWTVRAATLVAVRMAHPVADRLERALELLNQLPGRATRLHQIHHPTPVLRRVGRRLSCIATPPSPDGGCPPSRGNATIAPRASACCAAGFRDIHSSARRMPFPGLPLHQAASIIRPIMRNSRAQ